MAYYRKLGSVPKTRHTLMKQENGAIAYEELMGEEGFSSDSSLLYHRNSLVAWWVPGCGSCRSSPSRRIHP